MSGNLEISLVNGISGDPAVMSSAVQSGDTLLFDAGSLEAATNRELLKVRVVAISHTHVDHFIGFDRIIRVNIPHFRTLEVVGPQNIHLNVMAKLRAYTWNLLEPGQIKYIVHEVCADGSLTTFQLVSDSNFEPQQIGSAGSTGARVRIPLQTTDSFALFAAVLDHGVPVLAYFQQLPDSLTVDKPALQTSGLTAGPWIADLQRLAAENQLGGNINVNGATISSRVLADTLLRPRQGDSALYVTDILFNASNLASIESLCPGGAGHLICEANYRDDDRRKALAKSHLTTKQAALIAARTKARDFVIFHVSNIYAGNIEASVEESKTLLEGYRKLPLDALTTLCQSEFPS